LGLVAFVATLILLLGLAQVVQLGSSVSPPPSTGVAPRPTGTAAPSPVGSPDPSLSAAPGAEAVLVGAGDIADCTVRGDEETADLLDSIDGTVFTAGDNAYQSGSADEFRDCYGPTWGRHVARTRPAPGNHDWGTPALAGYLDYFGTAASTDDASWYSYDLGTWHVIVLDSSCANVDGCGPDSDQGRWLATDLADNVARCTLAVFHTPRWSSGIHGDTEDVAPFWTALHTAGAELVINGHDHDYERFAPQDPDGKADPERGMREFVVGTGGAPLRPFSDRIAPNSELRVSLTHGVLKLVLREGSYEWEFVPTSTQFSDRGNGFCH
jgi:hypothetical protein